MFEMQNTQMTLSSVEPLSMVSTMLDTTTDITTTPANVSEPMTPDMIFNAGHQLSIVVYRFLIKNASITRLVV
jgi:hypothetical protein